MSRPPEQYANKPNLWRLACELAKFKEPYKATDMLLDLVRPMLERERKTPHLRRIQFSFILSQCCVLVFGLAGFRVAYQGSFP